MGLDNMTWAERRARYDALRRDHNAALREMEARHTAEREALIPQRLHVDREYVSLSDNCPHPAADVRVGARPDIRYCTFCNHILPDAREIAQAPVLAQAA